MLLINLKSAAYCTNTVTGPALSNQEYPQSYGSYTHTISPFTSGCDDEAYTYLVQYYDGSSYVALPSFITWTDATRTFAIDSSSTSTLQTYPIYITGYLNDLTENQVNFNIEIKA